MNDAKKKKKNHLHNLRIFLWINRVWAQIRALPQISAETGFLLILESPRGSALELTDRIATSCLILGQASKG